MRVSDNGHVICIERAVRLSCQVTICVSAVDVAEFLTASHLLEPTTGYKVITLLIHAIVDPSVETAYGRTFTQNLCIT